MSLSANAFEACSDCTSARGWVQCRGCRPAIEDLRSPGDVVAAIIYTSGTSAATAKPGQA
jgi:hypothetical protein